MPLAAEETLDDVLNNHFEAIGGLDAWQAVESLRMDGRMVMPTGMEAPFSMTFARPMKTRLEFTFQGMTGIQAYDGETAWAIMPFMGSSDPQVMPDEQAKMMREQADFDGPLVNWKEKGNELELVGTTDVEGTEAYHVKVTLESGDVRHYFIDSEYYLPIKLEAKTTIQGNEMEIETTFGDYKEVGDLVMAHSIESKPKGAPSGQMLTIDSMELNIDLEEDIFTMPEVEESAEEAEAAE